jgi:tripartite ATP-independent transporter DctP family solute receptor
MRAFVGMAVVSVMLGWSFDAAAAKTMKVGVVTQKERSLSKGLVKFAELLEKETNGEIKVQVFTDGVLGGDRQVLESLQMGTVQGTTVSTGPIASFAPRFNAFDLPFLFKDKATAYRVVDGPLGQELLGDLTKAGFVGLGYWENGYRHLTNSRREVKVVEDIKGLKIRTLENPLHVELWKTLGANPTPMAYTQLYTALEQKVVDGQENPFGNVQTSKFDEVQKFLTKTGHVYNASPFLVSKAFWDTLSDKEKEAVKKAAFEARDYQRQLNDKEDRDAEAYLSQKGMKITEFPGAEKDKALKLLAPLYKEWSGKIGGDLVSRLQAATK